MVWLCTFPEALPLERGSVVACGNFDGVHAGHRHLLQVAQNLAKQEKLPLIALTFHPHPRSILTPHNPPLLLQTLPEKTAALGSCGVEGVAVVPFSAARAQQTAEDFVQEILITWLRATTVVVGENFRFGHRAQGTPTLLAGIPQFRTSVVPLAGDAEGAYSSSRLRAKTAPL